MHQNAGWLFYSQKNQANLKKKNFLQNFAANFLPFLKLFSTKNAENDYFNQPLECTAPKLWSKYTTHFIIVSLVTAIFSRLSWSQRIFVLKFHTLLKVIVLLMLKTFLASTYIWACQKIKIRAINLNEVKINCKQENYILQTLPKTSPTYANNTE